MRLFVGIGLPDAVRQHLARLGAGVPGARWVAPENMHITLRFIGDVPPAGREIDAEDVDAALAAVDQAPFALHLEGVGNFGTKRKARNLWGGVAASPALVHLRDKVESAIVRAGFGPEGRKFTPHVTLARLKGAPMGRVATFVEAHGALHTAPFTVDHFTLFESIRGHGGAVYRAIAEYPLAEYPLAER